MGSVSRSVMMERWLTRLPAELSWRATDQISPRWGSSNSGPSRRGSHSSSLPLLVMERIAATSSLSACGSVRNWSPFNQSPFKFSGRPSRGESEFSPGPVPILLHTVEFSNTCYV